MTIDLETIEKLQKSPIADRIALIELLVTSLKNDLPKAEAEIQPQRPAFGFMKDTGRILGDVVAPILPESTWEVLQ